MSIIISDHQPPPDFGLTFRNPTPFFYFHHIIDAETASLKIEVLGPDLSYTFTHSRVREFLPPSSIKSRLQQKTVGFLTLVRRNNSRVVLAWAESGHGMGVHGDFLDAAPHVLPNCLWTRRVIRIGRLMGMSMIAAFDNVPGMSSTGMSGMSRGCHVEVKLAVHAIFTLLRVFKITDDLDHVTRNQLRKLRQVCWQDGNRPQFEIYFSRRYCTHCRGLVTRLELLTGISIGLRWKPRVTLVEYNRKTNSGGPGRIAREIEEPPSPESEDVDMQDLDLGDEVTGGEEAAAPDDDIVSISSAETVGDEDDMLELIDLTREMSCSPVPPPSTAARPGENYIDGLAYCVGQMDASPQGAQGAIVEFSRIMKEMALRRRANDFDGEQAVGATRDDANGENHPGGLSVMDEEGEVAFAMSTEIIQETARPDGEEDADAASRRSRLANPEAAKTRSMPLPPGQVNKPLPATPETDPPGWMASESPEDTQQQDINTNKTHPSTNLPIESRSRRPRRQRNESPSPFSYSGRTRSSSPRGRPSEGSGSSGSSSDGSISINSSGSNISIRQRSPSQQSASLLEWEEDWQWMRAVGSGTLRVYHAVSSRSSRGG